MSIATITYDRWNTIPHVPNRVKFDVTAWDGVTYLINNPWKLHYIGDIGEFEIILKTGFQTDGGSVPSLFWNIISPWGKNTPAFLFHDGLYATEYLTRPQADWIMLECMQACGTNWVERNGAWRCVRDFGDSVWKKHTPKSIKQAKELVDFKIISYNKFLIPEDIEK